MNCIAIAVFYLRFQKDPTPHIKLLLDDMSELAVAQLR